MTIQKVLNNVADSVSQYVKKVTNKAEYYGRTFSNLNEDKKLAVIAKTAVAAGAAGIIGVAFCPALTGLAIVGGAVFGFKYSIDSCGNASKLVGIWSHVYNNPKGGFSNIANSCNNFLKTINPFS